MSLGSYTSGLYVGGHSGTGHSPAHSASTGVPCTDTRSLALVARRTWYVRVWSRTRRVLYGCGVGLQLVSIKRCTYLEGIPVCWPIS